MTRLSRLAALLSVLTLLPLESASGYIRLAERRVMTGVADCDWAHAADADSSQEQWGYWNAFLNPVADLEEENRSGTAYATAFQISEFLDQGISVSGGTGGGWVNIPGTYSASSLAYFLFYVETCANYRFFAQIDPGDGFGTAHVKLRSPFTTIPYETLESGVVDQFGLLGPGVYSIETLSAISSQSAESQSGPAYSLIWVCVPCDSPRIWIQPRDTVVVCGTTINMTVTPSPFAQSPTYQWRRNGVLLTDGGNISGATTANITIQGACFPDEGYYDVLLTDGSVVEPSRLARLRTVADITAVDAPPGPPGVAFSVAVAGANPFAGATSFRYMAAVPVRATMAIYNVAGARVRTLSDGIVSGAGVVTWDGTTESGGRATAGVYFLRVEAGSIRESRKVVLLR